MTSLPRADRKREPATMSRQEIAALIHDELATPSRDPRPTSEVVIATAEPGPQVRWLVLSMVVALVVASIFLMVH
jgi:hypothetical protein